ncbi:hypothetical protein FB45DRAFT_1033131 [Roridomyces roridus]|uniref:Uncharacterized protein n=1 Tax=Roridomyces roridus TaxID=1738132 RepID=A0AAD7BH26_9AGAR|nr:hypothetical protein FB45DRAFT_1033081 [Roridomyces roridus]KAJ7620461.1 hypothetical protein FB45DRAFT_1033131 [Roridomyces roridus]
MQFLAALFLLLPALSLVGAASFLQNITVEDTSKDILYSGSKFQCSTDDSCGIAPALQGSFKPSTTFTNGSITFRFTGVAYYAEIVVVGSAMVQLDGVQPGTTLGGNPGVISHLISATGLKDETHTLTIHPTPGQVAIIGLESLIYTLHHGEHHHTAAIVIGGFAVVLGILLAAIYAYRRTLILRRNRRKSEILRRMDAAWNHSTLAVGEQDEKDVVFEA